MLRQCGEALYGPAWQSQLARSLDLSDRMIRFYLSEKRAIPSDLSVRLANILADRRKTISYLLKALR